jgi:PKD repeat protein
VTIATSSRRSSEIPATRSVQYETPGLVFTASPVFGAAPLTTGFGLRDYQYHADQSYSADFGDGTVQNMVFNSLACSEPRGCYDFWAIEHTYNVPGSYAVTVYGSGPKRVIATTTVFVTGPR